MRIGILGESTSYNDSCLRIILEYETDEMFGLRVATRSRDTIMPTLLFKRGGGFLCLGRMGEMPEGTNGDARFDSVG